MNQTAALRERSSEIASARLLISEASNEKSFSLRAFLVISALLLTAWFLTG